MHEYCYYEHPTAPDLDALQAAILTSAMYNKDVAYCEWIEAEEEVEVFFNTALNTSDKAILESIVAGV